MDTKEGYKLYDAAFLGTSPLVLIEAAYQSFQKKTVLVIDADYEIGGAWKSLNLFNHKKVENAIHYFMPNEKAERFFKEYLGLQIKRNNAKFRIYILKNGKSVQLKYDSLFSKVIANFIELIKLPNKLSLVNKLFNLLFSKKYISDSFYVEGGSPAIIEKVKKLLELTSVEIVFGKFIERININENLEIVNLISGEEIYSAKNLFVTHGSRIFSLSSEKSTHQIVEKQHYRPALHLYFKDEDISEVEEAIFVADSLIKYAHNISDYAESNNLKSRKIIVLALQHNVLNSELVRHDVVKKLVVAGVVGKNAQLIDFYWQDVYLPRLETEDLEKIYQNYPKCISYLKTENFSGCIDDNFEKWTKILPKI